MGKPEIKLIFFFINRQIACHLLQNETALGSIFCNTAVVQLSDVGVLLTYFNWGDVLHARKRSGLYLQSVSI